MTNTNEQLLAIAADAFQLAADLATQNQNDLGARANAIGSKLRSLVSSFDERSTAELQGKENPRPEAAPTDFEPKLRVVEIQ
jgi:hypothetical protein